MSHPEIYDHSVEVDMSDVNEGLLATAVRTLRSLEPGELRADLDEYHVEVVEDQDGYVLESGAPESIRFKIQPDGDKLFIERDGGWVEVRMGELTAAPYVTALARAVAILEIQKSEK